MAMKIAVAGLGRIGWKFHFRESVASPDFDLVAVVDPLEERRSEAEVESGCRRQNLMAGMMTLAIVMMMLENSQQ